jgi:hypothetical protein
MADQDKNASLRGMNMMNKVIACLASRGWQMERAEHWAQMRNGGNADH